MSKYLQLSMGFTEIAYRGLENDSRLVGSHVVRNGGVIFEIVNTLETVEDDNVLKFPYFQHDLAKFQEINKQDHLDKFKVTTSDLIFDFVNNRIESFANSSRSFKLGRNIYNKISASRSLQNTMNEFILNTINSSETIYNDIMECTLIQKFLKKHGEGVMDISFQVVDVDYIFNRAIQAGAGIIRLPKVLHDNNGKVKLATISIPNTDIQHTLVQLIDYTGPFLPGYFNPVMDFSTSFQYQLGLLPPVNLECLDHCVENYASNQMIPQVKFYAEIFGFHKFWSVDESDISTENTSLRSTVMASSNGRIKMPINEPGQSKMKSQIQEFNDFNGGPGVQHIALKTNDIIGTVSALIKRGIEFNVAAKNYYPTLERRLNNDDISLYEDFQELKKYNILVDYDYSTRNNKSKRCNYLLQIFTKPLHDRPTLFIEIIQRHHHNGFGRGTFKGLFESIEEQQKIRGTFVEVSPRSGIFKPPI
ncbi:4-hydroxyphenylpyruvate dioxygenase [Spathaspora passalidarum NRRL Y-27907]|uniref:4-hydroxyphenylpyruvate dioxygenase n=1 Tax=Spathaspora passalidarum (strain NRRL Y-27907 / 11-Y1) TaxID=619300 RepID=G3AL54_SPAPN|nr:4-hydroxyphenylpyruvate dioxygenase [Spathaspora passalidarum NRRL Y-27907]EGW33097.1 4-hydroxyphenylpyruvate dioxygenase [Spathaspora passalidarum NRRL Y-27907]